MEFELTNKMMLKERISKEKHLNQKHSSNLVGKNVDLLKNKENINLTAQQYKTNYNNILTDSTSVKDFN